MNSYNSSLLQTEGWAAMAYKRNAYIRDVRHLDSLTEFGAKGR